MKDNRRPDVIHPVTANNESKENNGITNSISIRVLRLIILPLDFVRSAQRLQK